MLNDISQMTNSSVLVALVLWLFSPQAVLAHDIDHSYIYLTIENQSVTGRIEMTTRDLNLALNLTLPVDNTLSLATVEPHREAITNYYRSNLTFAIDGAPMKMSFGEVEIVLVSFGKFANINFTLTSDNSGGDLAAPETIDIENNLIFDADSNHRSLVLIENHWRSGTLDNEVLSSLIYDNDNRVQTLDIGEGSILQGLWGFIKSGAHHIWVGLDHIFFLLALLLPSVMVVRDGRWQGAEGLRTVVFRVLTIVTAFTVAHSVTLSIAALGVVTLPSRVVESIIALSIGIAAIHLIKPSFRTHSIVVVLAFGLFHGFGFASVLGELRIPSEYLAWSLFGFNIGVELGQLAIVIGVLPILYLLRNTAFYRRVVLPCGAAGLLIVSAYWLYERIFDVNIPVKAPIRALLGL